MTLDLGPVSDLATALGLLTPSGDPNPSWFGHPDEHLATVLADEVQREALVAFVDEALGGEDRTTDASGAVWLPVVSLAAPDPPLDVSVTIDDTLSDDYVALGLGLGVTTSVPRSRTTIHVPLFRAAKKDRSVPDPFLLGAVGGRITVATEVAVDSSAPSPGQAHLGAIGLSLDVPTTPGDDDPVFALTLRALQLPGASTPRDVTVGGSGADDLDDAILDLVLSLVRAQLDGAAGTPLHAIGGMLGLVEGDALPDFPITGIAQQGIAALAAWLHDLLTVQAQRDAWVGYLASLLGASATGDAVELDLGPATVLLRLRVDTGPTGNPVIRPTVSAVVADGDRHVEARAELCTLDLLTGAATALPSLGLWASTGTVPDPVLDLAAAGSFPSVLVEAVRVGFGLDAARRLTFVLAADGVTVGSRPRYDTLDLTSPDAVMDAVGQTLEQVAGTLLGGLGDALEPVKVLLGLEPPAGAPGGFPVVTVPGLLTDPLGAVTEHWRTVLTDHRAQVDDVLSVLADALSDAAAGAVAGSGTAEDPWRVPLVGPVALHVVADGPRLALDVAIATSVSTLGQHCTVVETHLAARLAELDLEHRTASLFAGVEARLHGRENGVEPSRARLTLLDGAAVEASYVGIRFGWTPAGGLSAAADLPGLRLVLDDDELPLTLPVVGADGSVSLPPEAWDALQELVARISGLLPSFLGDVTAMLGWAGSGPATASTVVLRLADLVSDPEAALRAWLPRLLMSELGPRALAVLADLLTAAGPASGLLRGTGHPDDPYVLDLHPGLPVPELAVWFPPEGLAPRLTAVPDDLRAWRPGEPGLDPVRLADALVAEAAVSAELRDLVEDRPVAAGLDALVTRWAGSDGRIVPPAGDVAGVTVRRRGLAFGQLAPSLDLEDLLGRAPATTVHVAVGDDAAAVWPDAPPDHRVDLTAPGLAPTMVPPPAPQPGEWFVALGSRTACRLVSGDDDGTAGQAARLAVVLHAFAVLGDDLVVVGHGGAGHAARLAAQTEEHVADVVTLGTPIGPVSLTVLDHQPEADALRLLHRLLPPEPTVADDADPDPDLPLARALVDALVPLTSRSDPGLDLRPPATALPVPRGTLTVTAVFGVVDRGRVERALTAAVAAGLARRAQDRATRPLPRAGGVQAGLRLAVPAATTGTLAVRGSAVLTLASFDQTTGLSLERALRVRCTVADRLGWLTSTADVELRKVSVDVTLPVGGSGAGTTSIVLHDARVFGRSWERLVLGNDPSSEAVLPEARMLLAAAVQRLTTDVEGLASLALCDLLEALGLLRSGGAALDAFDQLVHDPAGLVRERVAGTGPALSSALDALLGPVGASFSLPERSLTVEAGSDGTGLFGWAADVQVSPGGIGGTLRLGPSASTSPAGSVQLLVDLEPFGARLEWHHPGRDSDVVALWPDPDGAAVARTFAAAAPSLAGHVALETMRRADETAQPVIDAALDALGLLSGAVTDVERHLRPLAGLLADPAGWLRSADSLASSPAKVQGLLDALRPLLGIGGGRGEAWEVADGVTLTATADGADVRLDLAVDNRLWDGTGDRVSGGLTASLTVGSAGPPRLGLDAHVGLPGADLGRQAVHAAVGAAGVVSLLLRPATGPDIVLLPFAGLGGLVGAAAKVLPFVLDRLAETADPVGGLVAHLGDGLGLRNPTPAPHFDPDLLATFAADPAAALGASAGRLVASGLPALADLVDDLTPPAVVLGGSAGEVSASVGALTLTWDPVAGTVGLTAGEVAVPGVDKVAGTVRVSAAGLDELTVTVGPAAIDAGTAVLRPFATVTAGLAPAGGRRVLVGLATADEEQRFAARWLLDPGTFSLVASDGALALPVDDPAGAAARAVQVLADLLVAVAMAAQPVKDLLATPVFDSSVANLLRGVVLEDVADPETLLEDLFDVTTIEARVAKLFRNIAAANISFKVDDQLELALAEQSGVVGLRAGLVTRWELNPGNDVTLWLENDDSWIEGNPAGDGGLVVGFLDTSAGLEFKPSLEIWGVGLRIGKSSGPLLDAGITLESVALHTYAELDLGGARAGGVQLELTNLALSVAGASGGNSIASGIVRDTGPQPPRPAFSPALAIQKHGSGDVEVTLRAGPGDGPWWIAIQKGFGPLYLEQLGLGVVMPQRRVESISLLIDGSVSLFGLQCQVDDLQITYLVSKDDFFNPKAWDIDLAGLAVSADMAGLTLAGGLLKQKSDAGIEYLGMLLARFGVYGITIYGGYGEGEEDGEKFVAFFAVGSVVGPIGGPPAFFLTGIGGGFGINRQLVVPTDLSKFGDYPLIKALDVAAKPGNPMDELRALGQWFPMKRGTFWFAAGLSFNSFALVDGIAVVAVEVGDGLDVNLLGLARMALPRPEVALVSIEIALLVRFSTSEGVLWVQGQLTDNSWLLVESVRLTGGFAFVTWFKGPHRGEFVLTLGGFHPDFHRDGYPVVPRLGLRVSLGPAVITAGTYFALTSEAVMAGGDFEASAELGPAWARIGFGAHGIVYFDPFRYQVMAYARIDAGVTIDLWLLGEVTIRVHLGARIEVEGPDFHGKARFEIGPVGVTVEFGSSDQTRKELLSASAFVEKYLEPTPEGAVVVSVVTTYGVQPSGAGEPTADGTPDRPFVVVCEFGLILTSTVPLARLSPDGQPVQDVAPSRVLGVAPMGATALPSAVSLHWELDGSNQVFPFTVAPRAKGAFPVGVWGPPQDDNNRKVPDGEIIEALHEATLEAHATESAPGPTIPYYQVEIGKRIPLPFKRKAAQVSALRNDAVALAGLVGQPADTGAAFALAKDYLGSVLSPTSLAALVRERQAPPRAGSLGEGLDASAITIVPDKAPLLEPAVVDSFVDAPLAVGLMRAATPVTATVPAPVTTVQDSARAWRTAPPTLASVDAERSRSIAATLSIVDATATPTLRGRTVRPARGAFDTPRARASAGSVVATGAAPTTAVGLGAVAHVARAGNSGEALAAFSTGLTSRRRRGTPGAGLDAGELAVLQLPNARRDVGTRERPRLALAGAPARVIVMGHGGAPLADTVAQDTEVEVPARAERIVVLGLGTPDGSTPVSLDGWHTGMQLPYLGWSSALARGATVQSVGQSIADHRERLDAGWVGGAELATGLSTVITRFTSQVRVVLVVLDDPTAFGDEVAGRRLVLGLSGAVRARDAGGEERKPVVVSMGNRTVLAYDVVPDGAGAVTVTIATEQGWSLVGVLGSDLLDADGAASLVSARGLDASLGRLADGPGRTALGWRGETRTSRQRAAARVAATPRAPAPARRRRKR